MQQISERNNGKKRNRKAQKRVARLFELVSEMEEPLRSAVDLTQALTLLGFGLESIMDKDASQPVLAVGEALSEKLAVLRERWRFALEAVIDQKAK